MAKEYTKLPGKSRRSGVFEARFCSLWMKEDHLLAVESNSGWSEVYKRFYLQDIQGFIVHRTSGLWWRLAGHGFFMLLFGGIGTAILMDDKARSFGMAIPFFVLGFVFGLFFFRNLVLGPTCVCHVKTAVQLYELPSLNRERRARKVIGQLASRIEAVQGTIPHQEMAERLAALRLDALSDPSILGGTTAQGGGR